MTNPLLEPWSGDFAIAPFDRIKDAHFAPAIDAALTQARAEVAAISANPEPASFANTIAAFETAGKTLDRVLSVFFVVASADSNPDRQRLQREVSPKLAAFSSDIHADKALFARIEALWQARDTLDLTAEQARLLMLTRRRFLRAGAALTGQAEARMKEIMARLAELGTAFTQNLLADEAGWHMELGENDLDGLPDFLITAARQAGQELGLDGPAITLSRSLVVPFLQFSPRRDLRERAFNAFVSRGAGGGEHDNRAIAAEILALREERARLLGYDSFAAYKLETEMAKTPGKVRELLMAVWKPARARAEADAQALTQMMQADGINGPLEPWDWRYYAEKRRQEEHDFDEAALKPYLQLDRMIEAAFDCANRLFGLEFRPIDVPLYHPDCRAWEVTREGRHMAVFIGDWFARASKRSGAWCTTLQGQARTPETVRPVVLNVCNFNKGTPALLSYDEARTLFHEFGHALHQMLSDVTYESLSGTNVARDFVELPSQLYEHWLEVPEVLERFATHAETGQPMPREMLQKVLGAANFDAGFETVEYVASALVDLDFHDGPAPADPMARQAEVLAEIGMPHAITMRHATPHFAHVFSGDGYSSGYYSYMWSEVMDADAFAAFGEAGSAFDPEMASALEKHILSVGGTAEADTLYRAFRGRLPGVEALLRGRGLAA
ncbi:M3 family metallopeptidase [Roseovarius amoyensis]|uniref:M3 family metallopeptidase n=1 Tax=Roseovarius amoyensis TaxID=2211448 RepID=UPI000DBE1DA0|nr:M3 family metallopeptidase [Roseovarius amoyensis]